VGGVPEGPEEPCDVRLRPAGAQGGHARARGRAYTPAGTPALRSEHAGLAQEASLKCQTTISTTKPDCSAQILAYRVSCAAQCHGPAPLAVDAAAPAFCYVGPCLLTPRDHSHRAVPASRNASRPSRRSRRRSATGNSGGPSESRLSAGATHRPEGACAYTNIAQLMTSSCPYPITPEHYRIHRRR